MEKPSAEHPEDLQQQKEIVEMLRQKSRPYLFSNTLAPSIVGASIRVLEILTQSTALRDKLETNTAIFRKGMTDAGFDIIPGVHPITPVMLYDAPLAQQFASKLLDEGIYVIGFSSQSFQRQSTNSCSNQCRSRTGTYLQSH